jgi:uncharacterized membrane protein YccF (DUF307 family)
MITEFFIWIAGGLVGSVAALFPTSDASATTTAAMSGVGTVMGYASGFGIWLPFGVMASCAAVVVGVLAVGLTIRLVRIVASFLSGGGGSAA